MCQNTAVVLQITGIEFSKQICLQLDRSAQCIKLESCFRNYYWTFGNFEFFFQRFLEFSGNQFPVLGPPGSTSLIESLQQDTRVRILSVYSNVSRVFIRRTFFHQIKSCYWSSARVTTNLLSKNENDSKVVVNLTNFNLATNLSTVFLVIMCY